MQEGLWPTAITTTLSADGTRAVVSVAGEIDIANSSELRAEVDYHVACGRHVVVDLAKVTFLDGSAVSVLVSAYRSAAERGLTMALTNVTHRAVARVLSITNTEWLVWQN